MENRKDTAMIDFTRTIYEIRKHWYYYVIAFVLFVGFGAFYMYKKNPVYLFHANMLIEQESGSGSTSAAAAMMKTFTMAGIGGGSIDDELLVFQSHGIAKQMVKELKLNRQYIDRDGVKNLPLYKNSPVEIEAPEEIFDTIVGFTMNVFIKENGTVDIKAKKGLFETVFEAENQTLPAVVTPSTGGVFALKKTEFFVPGEEKHIIINVSDNDFVAENYNTEIFIDYASVKSNGILMELEDNNTQRGLDILNKMFEVYNERRLNENNKKAEAELKFVDERLASVTEALTTSEKDLEKFKLDNKLTDMTAEAGVLLQQNTVNNQSVVEQQTQIAILDMVNDFLAKPENSYSLIPINTGINNEVAARTITDYNDLILKRMQLNLSAKTDNKALKVMDEQIDAMRAGVVSTIKNIRNNAYIAYKELTKAGGEFSSRLNSLSKNEREFFNLERNKTIQNNLYLFLIEQRENNLLKLGANAPVGRVVDVAYREALPIKPKLSIVMGLAVLMSLLLPTLWFVIITFYTKYIALKFDVNRFSDASEIVEVSATDSDSVDLNSKSAAAAELRLLRNSIARTNPKTVLITSIFEGEGKTFIASHLIKMFANSGKKIAVVDINSSGKISKLLGNAGGNGVVDYILNGNKIDSIIKPTSIDSVSLITPGNDISKLAEVLANEAFTNLLSSLKESFDMVIIVSGDMESNMTLPLLTEKVDKSILVIRSGQLRKPYLKLYKLVKPQLDEEKMIAVVNGIVRL